MEANKITLKTLTISIAAVFAIETVFRLAISGQPGSPLSALGIIRFLEALLLVFIAGRFEKNQTQSGCPAQKCFQD